MLFSGRSSTQRKSITANRSNRRPATSRRRGPQLELLETRDLLSGLTPAYVILPAAGAATPLSTTGPAGYSPAQVRHGYGFDQVSFNGVPGDGRGTTIAIVDAYDDPTVASDLHQFDQYFGLPDPAFTKVNQNGGSTPPPADVKGWANEIALDVEWAHAIAPRANILLVEANDDSFTNLFAAVDYARSQPGVVAVSMSWAGPEWSGETAFDSYLVTPAGHTPVAFIASSGDWGAPVLYPAASPNVLAVGGTTLNLDGAGKYLGESGWSYSGGGVSSVEPQPAFQQGVVSGPYRANPDVAYDADPNTGFPVYLSYNNSAAPWLQFGGTSAGAPQWAALVALADQGRALAGRAALDGPSQLLPALYQLPASDFHDVTTGSSQSSQSPPGPSYSAGPGYDLVTGRGSPLANRVVADLVGPTTPAPVATHFQVTTSSTATAGSAVSVTVTALDANNNTVSGYTGTVHFSSSDGQAVLPADYTFTSADAGAHTFSATLKTAGTQSITATDTATSTFTGQAGITVSPAAVDHLLVSAPTSAAPRSAFTVSVTAQDAYGNTVTSFRDTVHFTSSDPRAVLPTQRRDYTFSASDKGVHTFSVTLKTTGSQTLTVTDTSRKSVTGTATVSVGVTSARSTATPAAAPAGYTPAQVSQAYGFDQVSLPGGAAGRGTTIASADAYDDPTTASGLHQLDQHFGLPDPAFIKFNQAGGTGSTLGGATTYSASDLTALYGLMAGPGWTDPGYSTEVRHLGDLGGSYGLGATTVPDAGALDALFGSPGDLLPQS